MVKLNDYLYDGHTVLSILHKYADDLQAEALEQENMVDLAHANFLRRMTTVLVHNDFLTAQSAILREFYKYLTAEYPHLAFTVKGRIKSLIRAEQKYNGYILESVYDHYKATGTFPSEAEIRDHAGRFRDLIAYRVVISMPKCHLKEGEKQEEVELKFLYQIANELPRFMEKRGFTAELSGITQKNRNSKLDNSLRPYYRDYIVNKKTYGYQSLHITFYDNTARCLTEIQLRTKSMDDAAEIGKANHSTYEKKQENSRNRRDEIPVGECQYFDDAYERVTALQELDLSRVDVNMFRARNNDVMNDGCGLFRGRRILTYEHLSGYQNDLID